MLGGMLSEKPNEMVMLRDSTTEPTTWRSRNMDVGGQTGIRALSYSYYTDAGSVKKRMGQGDG